MHETKDSEAGAKQRHGRQRIFCGRIRTRVMKAKILRDFHFWTDATHHVMGSVRPHPARAAAITLAAFAASSHGSFYSHALFLSRQLRNRCALVTNHVVSISDAFDRGNIEHVDMWIPSKRETKRRFF
jgi:hypothetical protein